MRKELAGYLANWLRIEMQDKLVVSIKSRFLVLDKKLVFSSQFSVVGA